MIALALRYWWAFVIAGLLVANGFQRVQVVNAKGALADLRVKTADEKTRTAQAAQAAEAAARTEEQRRAAATREVIDEAKKQASAARADADDAGRAADSLRQRVAALVAVSRARPGNPAPAGGSPPADAISVFADVLGRIDEAAGRYAAAADIARGAGLACQRYADQVRAGEGVKLLP